MHFDQLHLSQITIEADMIPIIFRGLFVLFLGMVMLWMKDDDGKKEIKKVSR